MFVLFSRFFFFASRRRHTRCAVVTGVQTCALPISKVMGILNITPDSFYDGGRHYTVPAALTQAERLLTDGADILDIGAYSSRPGAADVSAAEESGRLLDRKSTRLNSSH